MSILYNRGKVMKFQNAGMIPRPYGMERRGPGELVKYDTDGTSEGEIFYDTGDDTMVNSGGLWHDQLGRVNDWDTERYMQEPQELTASPGTGGPVGSLYPSAVAQEQAIVAGGTPINDYVQQQANNIGNARDYAMTSGAMTGPLPTREERIAALAARNVENRAAVHPNMSDMAFNMRYREFPTVDDEIDDMDGLGGFLGGNSSAVANPGGGGGSTPAPGGGSSPGGATTVVTPGGGGGASGGSGGASPQRAAEQVAANKEAKKIAAIKRLQINNGVEPTGVMDQDTLDSINTVREEQKALNKLNPEFKLVLDGNRGRKTKGAAERMANPATSVGNITATPEASAAPELAPISLGDEQAARVERQAVRAGNQLSRQEERANRQAARQGRRAERQLVRQGNRANRREFRDENPGFLKRFMSK